jgi:hypothetical protein
MAYRSQRPYFNGMEIVGADNTALQQCSISSVENAFWLESNNRLIKANYLHDFHSVQATNRPAH